MTLVKHYHVNYVYDDNKPFIITYKYCNRLIICAGKSGELIFIPFIHADMSTIGILPEDISPGHFFFQWTGGTKNATDVSEAFLIRKW